MSAVTKRRRGTAQVARLIALALIISTIATAYTFSGHRKAAPVGIHKIRHVVVIMQENRSFDNYFGTFPGADGIPMTHGAPAVCLPDTRGRPCVRPFPDHLNRNDGGPHQIVEASRDVDGGRMDGFVKRARIAGRQCVDPQDPACISTRHSGPPDVAGYHTESDLPNYWKYARDFVLQDHMFEPTASWSLPAHLFMVSEWAARCATHNDPSSCTNAQYLLGSGPGNMPRGGNPFVPSANGPIYAWTDLTYLLHNANVSWRYYVTSGVQPDCVAGTATCAPVSQSSQTPGVWNPLPYFDTVRNDHQLGNIQPLHNFMTAAKRGRLADGTWIVPSQQQSEHPPAPISAGVAYVTRIINAIMRGPDWSSTAIFVAWDDWGGFYDNVVPPKVDENGYGLRAPGLVISPYAKSGFVDHQVLSFDAYLKFIEDDFLNGQRLDPKTDGRPDPRPTVRDDVPILGDLAKDFDFNQRPRPPVLLPVHPKTTLIG